MNAVLMILRGANGEELTIPVLPWPRVKREFGSDGNIADCVLAGNPARGVPVWIEIVLRSDGSWQHWVTRFKDEGASYLLIEQPSSKPATEAQRRTVARWWFELDPRPFGMPLGATVCQWAFDGMSPDEISRRYGNGSPVFLAGGE